MFEGGAICVYTSSNYTNCESGVGQRAITLFGVRGTQFKREIIQL